MSIMDGLAAALPVRVFSPARGTVLQMGDGWDETLAVQIIGRVVADHHSLFKRFPDLGKDDLAQDLLIQVRRAFPSFNARRRGGRKFSSWVFMIARRKLLNSVRDRERRGRWEAVAASGRQYASITTRGLGPDDHRRVPIVQPDEVPEPVAVHVEGDLAEWLTKVHAQARVAFNLPADRQGRRGYTAAQSAACGLLMQKLNLTVRGAVMLFESRVDLRRAIGLCRLPSHRWFWLAGKVVTDSGKKSRPAPESN